MKRDGSKMPKVIFCIFLAVKYSSEKYDIDVNSIVRRTSIWSFSNWKFWRTLTKPIFLIRKRQFGNLLVWNLFFSVWKSTQRNSKFNCEQEYQYFVRTKLFYIFWKYFYLFFFDFFYFGIQLPTNNFAL